MYKERLAVLKMEIDYWKEELFELNLIHRDEPFKDGEICRAEDELEMRLNEYDDLLEKEKANTDDRAREDN